jgi:hypothetical protein
MSMVNLKLIQKKNYIYKFDLQPGDIIAFKKKKKLFLQNKN